MKTSTLAFLLSRSRPLSLLGLAALLAACSSTPLPPWPGTPDASAGTAPKARPGVVVPPPLGTPARSPAIPPQKPTPSTPEGVTITPIGAALPDATSLPFGAAVAARFPDPAVRYHTPGLEQGRSSYTSNAELAQWLRELQSQPSGAGTRLVLEQIGHAQSGSPLLGLIATRAAGTDPASLQASGHPTVLLIGQQHGDEPAGSEALLAIARELAPGGLLEPLLDKINVILVPRANPDGAEAGQRNTASGVDMNRDHLLLTTPEAQALAQLVRNYRPLAVLDAHEYTVGGRFLEKFHALPRYDALLQYATTPNVPDFVTKAAREWYYPPMVDALGSQGLSSDWYYTTSTDLQDMRLSMGGIRPDTGRNVNGLKNAVSMLVETRGIGIGRTHLQRRVHTQVTALTSALRSTAERAKSLEQVRSFVARDVSAQACRGQVVIDAAPTRSERELLMIDPQTGADRSLRLPWDSALQLQTTKSRPRPCGYWLSADAGSAVERLRLLGLQVLQVAENGSVLAETFSATESQSAPREDVRGTVEGSAAIVRVEVAPHRAAIDVPAGSYYVPLSQPWANLAVAALEPDTQSSYFANHLLPSLADSARIMAPPALVFEED